MSDYSKVRISGDRLWQRLMDMAKIGATDAGGCNRQALTDLDKEGRDLFIDWCHAAGCKVRIDQMGNVFARRAGLDNSLPPVITGSHLDTQPTGGKFDGVYGVLAGLEVIESLNDNKLQTKHPLEVVVWTNEEGARFSPAMIGSGVWCGEFDIEDAHVLADKDGLTIGDELKRIGYHGAEPCKIFPVKAAFETHIEQGPILEAEEKTIGIVTGVQGMRWYDVMIKGQPVHAGPTPMEVRRDPFRALTKTIDRIYALAEEHGPWGRATFGDIQAVPGARNTVPETLILAVDLRHPNQEVLEQMDKTFRIIVEEEALIAGVESTVKDEWDSPAVAFDKDCIEAVTKGVKSLNLPYKVMASGAGHDSVYVSRSAPTSMIFIPCKDGISHNEAEDAHPDDLTAGCNVLLQAMCEMAN